MKITKRNSTRIGIILCTAIVLFIALPSTYKSFAPAWMQIPTLHYGLDLVGGTQLDFRISERELDESIMQKEAEAKAASGTEAVRLQNEVVVLKNQKANLTEAIRTVLERRINSLGVSEAVITPAEFGGEKHLLVECPGVVDKQQCIDTVGKTIQLEFKEEQSEATPEYEKQITELANTVFAKVKAGSTLAELGDEYSSELAISYAPNAPAFKDQLPKGLENFWSKNVGDAAVLVPGEIPQPVQTANGFEMRQLKGYYIAQVASGKTIADRTIFDATEAMKHLATTNPAITFSEATASVSTLPQVVAAQLTEPAAGKQVMAEEGDTGYIVYVKTYTPAQERMNASQIFVTHKDAFGVGKEVTRSKEEAKTLIDSLKTRLTAGENFATLARQFSDGTTASKGGIQEPFTKDEKDEKYSEVAFALAAGAVSDVVETPFGYYILKAVSAPVKSPDSLEYSMLTVKSGEGVPAIAGLNTSIAEQKVTKPEEQITLEYLFFSQVPTGWKDTELNGKQFRSATVTLDEYNRPIVQINFSDEGAKLFQELTKANVGKRVAIFVGGDLVSAPTVQQEITGGTAVITGTYSIPEARALALDLNTGAIPAPIYLTGQRTIEATLGAEALRTAVQAALIGILALMVYMVLMYRILGLLANIALVVYAVLFVALLKLPLFLFSDQYIVLSLAGLAGIILSIGMAVDANVLIFERMREEMRTGKGLASSTTTGFERAWPSIRDGNLSTLITCAILFMIGTSIIKGFAITLSMGVLLSMFSAITVTKALVHFVARSPLGKRTELFR